MPVFKKVSQTSSLAVKSKGSGIDFRYAVDEESLKEKPEKPLYLLIDSNLRQLATTACNAVSKYYNDCSDLLLGSQIVIKCSKAISAKNNAKLFYELRMDRSNTTTTSDNGWKYLIEPDGISINITLPEYLSFDHDIQDIANEIIRHTKDVCIQIDRRLNRLVKQYLKVKGTEYVSFSNNYPPLGDVNVDRLAIACVNVRTEVLHFLTAFQRACTSRMRRVINTQDKTKAVRISIGENLNVRCNKKKINLNYAKKASLFALALFDINNIRTKDYVLKRKPYLEKKDYKFENYTKSFNQYIATLKTIINGLISNDIGGGFRQVVGIQFKKPIPEKEIEAWLKNKDNVLKPNSAYTPKSSRDR